MVPQSARFSTLVECVMVARRLWQVQGEDEGAESLPRSFVKLTFVAGTLLSLDPESQTSVQSMTALREVASFFSGA